MSPLFTIGYEHATASAVLDEIARAGVGVVIDVRAIAASRRPGFSKRQFAAALDERGIGYLHLRGLGTPKEGRLAARAGDVATLFQMRISRRRRRARNSMNSPNWCAPDSASAWYAMNAIPITAIANASRR